MRPWRGAVCVQYGVGLRPSFYTGSLGGALVPHTRRATSTHTHTSTGGRERESTPGPQGGPRLAAGRARADPADAVADQLSSNWPGAPGREKFAVSRATNGRAPSKTQSAARGNKASASRASVNGCWSGRAPKARPESCQPRKRRPPLLQPSWIDRSRAYCPGEHGQQWMFVSMVNKGPTYRTVSEA